MIETCCLKNMCKCFNSVSTKTGSDYKQPQMTTNHQQTTRNHHKTLVNDHKPSVKNHKPPGNNYKPSVNKYNPPVNNHKPPANHKLSASNQKPPANDHKLPGNYYKLPANDHKRLPLHIKPKRWTFVSSYALGNYKDDPDLERHRQSTRENILLLSHYQVK